MIPNFDGFDFGKGDIFLPQKLLLTRNFGIGSDVTIMSGPFNTILLVVK